MGKANLAIQDRRPELIGARSEEVVSRHRMPPASICENIREKKGRPDPR